MSRRHTQGLATRALGTGVCRAAPRERQRDSRPCRSQQGQGTQPGQRVPTGERSLASRASRSPVAGRIQRHSRAGVQRQGGLQHLQAQWLDVGALVQRLYERFKASVLKRKVWKMKELLWGSVLGFILAEMAAKALFG